MLVSLKRCKVEYTKQSIHLESFNDECATAKGAQNANLLSQESKLTRVDLQLNWCPSKSTTLSQNGYFFNTLNFISNHDFSRTHYKLVRL